MIFIRFGAIITLFHGTGSQFDSSWSYYVVLVAQNMSEM